MTITSFWLLFLLINMCLAIIGSYLNSSIKDSDYTLILGIVDGVILMGGVIGVFAIIIMDPIDTPIPNYNWYFYLLSFAYIILVTGAYLTENYTFPWKRSYYEEYGKLCCEYTELKSKYNILQKQFDTIEKRHQKELEYIIKHKPLLEYKPTNIKLHII